MTRDNILSAALATLLVGLPMHAISNERKPAPPDPTEDKLLLTAGFLEGHPDLKYRLLGMEHYEKGDYDAAIRFFRRAAFYGDKPSQGKVAEMIWDGEGATTDRALAYAWMDLAAERGYAGLLGFRERYWAALEEQERARAIEEGEAVYARYGDAAALPRLAGVLRRERNRVTGSRTGAVGNVQIYVPGPGGAQRIDGASFYDPRYWDPEQYLAWHDSVWMNPRTGRVSVGDPENASQDTDDRIESRVPTVAPEVDAPEPEVPEPAPR